MNDTDPLAYERVAQSSVYETRVAGSVGWSGYLLPPPPGAKNVPLDDLPAEIDVADSLDKYSGHYLFCATRPALLDTDPAGFAKTVFDHLSGVAGASRAVLWLQRASPLVLGDFKAFGFTFGPGAGGQQVTSKLESSLGSNVQLVVLPQTSLGVDTDFGGLLLSAPNRPSGPYIDFLALTPTVPQPLGVLLANDNGSIQARIPVSGTNSGALTFQGQMLTNITFGPQGVVPVLQIVVKDRKSGKDRTITYGVYNLIWLPPTLQLVGTFDPSDPVNSVVPAADLQSGHLRSGFAVVGAPELQSYYLTSQGRIVLLTPVGAGASDLVPPLFAGGFAWATNARTDAAPGTGAVYLAPTGSHGIGVTNVGAAKAQALLGGLFGSEQLTFQTYDATKAPAENDRLFFLPAQAGYAPVFPFETAGLDDPASGGVRARLSPERRVAWATILPGASAVEYRAEPEGSALYGKGPDGLFAGDDDTAILLSAPPRMALSASAEGAFPLLPYGAAGSAGADGGTLTQLESQIIAPTRKAQISSAAATLWEARLRARAQAPSGPAEQRTTPQGFIVQSDPETGAYFNVRMAQSLNRRGDALRCDPSQKPEYLPFAFDRPTRAVQDALQTNQLFLVAVDDAPFDDPHGACFESTVNIADWTMTAQVGKNATPTSYRNVVIFKFCSGSLQERITNPNRWTAPEDFSLVAGTSPDVAALSFTGLSQWLQDYVAQGIARASGRSAAFYENFRRIVTDPEWNGVIVLAGDLGAGDLPPPLAALAAGIDLTLFAAHHFGFSASRVEVDKTTGDIRMGDGDSSLFGLVDYEDPRYAANLDAGVDPDTPIPVTTSNDLDFTVLSLKSLFENARLTDFESRIQLTVDRLFAARVTDLLVGGVAQPATGVVLAGSYVDQGGEPSYVFEQANKSVLLFDSNVLPAVAFNRVQFNTLGTRDEGGTPTVASRFLVWGAFDFAELEDRQSQLLDVTSFGSSAGTASKDLGVGLAFSGLVVEMTFPQSTPTAKSFAVETANLAWDLNASSARDDSLFKGFGLQLKGFVNAQGGQTPADLGFLPVTSTLDITEIEGPWFGVVYDITLGGPGALASAVGFSSSLLVSWSPTSAAADGSHALFLGMSLPGAAPGAKLFSLQGVLKVAVGSISILRQPVQKAPGREDGPDEYFYCLRIDDIGLKVFGIVKLPPSANIQFFLFGDPSSTGSLGWYAAYVADDNPGCNQQALGFAEVRPRPALPDTAESTDTLAAV